MRERLALAFGHQPPSLVSSAFTRTAIGLCELEQCTPHVCVVLRGCDSEDSRFRARASSSRASLQCAVQQNCVDYVRLPFR